jgi:O-antigen ligase
VNEVRTIEKMILPIAVQVVIQAIVGLAQFLQQHSIGLGTLGELTLDPRTRGVSIVWSAQSTLLRAYGLTDHPNILGGCLAFALILLMLGYIRTGANLRGIVASVFALGTLALLLTFSRAAWLAFGVGAALVAILFFVTRQKNNGWDLIRLGLAVSILVIPFVWSYASYLGVRFNSAEPSMLSGENRAIVERSVLDEAGYSLWANHPLVGVGIGAFPIALRAAQPNFPFDYQPAHIVLLDVAAETGIFGAMFYFILLLAPWVMLIFNRRRLNFAPAFVVVTGLLLAITLVGFFDYYTWLLNPGRLWQWLTWGFWSAMYSMSLGANHA